MAVKIIEGKNYHCGTKMLTVKISADMSHTGKERLEQKPVDACIADIVNALNLAGIFTDGCCCGHGVGTGSIVLTDGRVIEVHFPDDWEAHKGNA